MPNTAPSLSGLAPSATFFENSVNTTPQLLDIDVTFTDAENNFTGGTLVLSGLLAEDTVAIRNQGTGAGEISFAAGVASYQGVAIGTVTGGAGSALNVTFNAAANSAAIDALIQNLTYSNSSDTPTATRALSVVVRDAAGAPAFAPASFTQAAGAANPLNGFDMGNWSTVAFGDLDGDGDLDLVSGDLNGRIFQITNTGTASAPAFAAPIQVSALTTPFSSYYSSVALGDMDGDGDLDMIASNIQAELHLITNTGSAASASFAAPAQIGTLQENLSGIPALGDLDGDGDLDIVLGDSTGNFFMATNTGSAAAPLFATLVQIPGLDVGYYAAPTLGDLDGDGDLDLVSSDSNGYLHVLTNTGTTAAPVFAAPVRIGTLATGFRGKPTLVDLDGDGDLDIVSGNWFHGTFVTFYNSAVPQITVTVTADDDPAAAENDFFSTTETSAITASNVFANNGSGVDIDPDSAFAVTAVNGAAVSVGVAITLASGALLTLNANGTFSYNTNGAFARLGVESSGTIGADLFASDSFTYTVTGGDTATVNVMITGVDNNDILHARAFAPLHGGVGNDQLFAATNQTSSLFGDDGNDILSGSGGADAMDGGAGIDMASYFNSAAVRVALDGSMAALGHAIGDTYLSIERVEGSNTGNDTLIGDSAANYLFGNGGDDQLRGQDGDDYLYGGAGGDQLTGGLGFDFASYRNSVAGVNASLDGSVAGGGEAGGDTFSSIENLQGSGGDDILAGNALANTIFGESGNDDLRGQDGNDILRGGAGGDIHNGGNGIDTASYLGSLASVAVALDGSIAAAGDAVGDTFTAVEYLQGGNQADILGGDALANRLFGEAGADTLSGFGGADFLRGGGGADTLTGGGGNDSFEFMAITDARDTITDFSSSVAGNNDSLRFLASAFGGGLVAGQALTAAEFTSNTTGLATLATHRFVYETDTGILRFDVNGSAAGGTTAIATLTGAPALVLADFLFI